MNMEWTYMAAERSVLGGIAPFLAGVVVVGVLVGALWLGARVRAREPRRPLPEEQPRLPDGGPVREEWENREPDEIPKSDLRLTPYEVHGNLGSRPSPSKERRRWSRGSSGSFGGGGLGAH
ncbi:hypothetical protein Sipo8835_02865 [Streptomyces ipomoeae]|jgi:hypothetical protein|uniref:Uncharacterized protein n=1 Tax=Streptomyces ipomoeae TaxID=103232 RepID=A0A540QUV4_9ACTN|nr:DUF6479 family protein [Streptomyces ipomoeae]MDX2695258.1 DUF6479 family protein [Streptomyces ipomoeae]MDX2823544.1 DUF6479 family protein [Streptomyces ipomoeae]MDX2841001.1 DUF6479 family protein [Streptomyces ipomoeae]MDX2875669.1 DUF6479 family protein [Streptomyces ipomoeae]MDX2937401.1 DUF6479 family protein [Streptomyces ipomoeae]